MFRLDSGSKVTLSLTSPLPQCLLTELHHPEFFLPESVEQDYPSHIHIDLMRRAQGQGVGVRMIKTILATLKAKGKRAHVEILGSLSQRKATTIQACVLHQKCEHAQHFTGFFCETDLKFPVIVLLRTPK